LWNRQGGSYTNYGFDVATEVKITRSVSATGSYSWVDETVFEAPVVGVKVLSIPKNKGSLGLTYRGVRNGFDGSIQMRAVEQFPVVSGTFKGVVDGYAVFDVTLGYRIPRVEHLRLSLSAQNVLDNRHIEFVGAPELGRLVVARIQWGF